MSSLHTRLKEALESIGLDKQKEAALKIGVSEGYLSELLKGKKMPSDFLLTTIEVRLGISAQWLLEGKEPMFVAGGEKPPFWKSTDITGKPVSPEGEEEPPIKEARPLRRIPVLGKVPAGFPEDVAGEILEYIGLPDVPARSYALIVKGESMSPGIRDGDYVLFISDGDYKSGDVVVVNNEFGDSMIKRYRVKPDGEIWLMSDNPEYPSFKPNEQYRIIGKAFLSWRKNKL